MASPSLSRANWSLGGLHQVKLVKKDAMQSATMQCMIDCGNLKMTMAMDLDSNIHGRTCDRAEDREGQ